MRIRLIVSVLLTLVGVAACTSSAKHTNPTNVGTSTAATTPTRVNTSKSKTPTAYCDKLVGAAPKINAAQASLYSGTGSAQAIDDLTTQLTALQSGAPNDLKAALADMATQFRGARDMVQRPTMQDRDRIAAFGQKISNDNRVLASYVDAHCPTG